MSVAFPPEFENYVRQAVESGRYASTDDAIREALRLLQARDRTLHQLREDVRAGFDQLDRGEGVEYDDPSLDSLFSQIESQYEQRAETKRSGNA